MIARRLRRRLRRLAGQILCQLGRHRFVRGVIQQPGEHVIAEQCVHCPAGRALRVYRCKFPLRRA